MEKKFGWTEKGIIGWIFSLIGAFFILVGTLLSVFGVGVDPAGPMLFLCVFGGMGAVFLLIGLGLVYADVNRRNMLQQAVDSGHYVMAKIVGVQRRLNVNVRGTHPYVVECHWMNRDSGELHVYYSRYLYFDPTDLFTAKEVPVYIDRMNEKYAFVDIDKVLPKVVDHR